MPIKKPEIDFCNKTHSLLHREIRINCHSYMVMLTLQVISQSIASVIAKHCKCHRKALQVPSQSFAGGIAKLCMKNKCKKMGGIKMVKQPMKPPFYTPSESCRTVISIHKPTYTEALIQSNMQLHTPNRSTPTVHRRRANFVEQSLLNAGKGLSVLLIYIAFTISR